MATLIVIALVFTTFAAGIFLLLRRVMAPAMVAECGPDWINEFSVSKYRPMLRLLDEKDFQFLATQPGFGRKTLRRLRMERRRIFRGYLRNLVCDFNRLHMAARMILLYSPKDRPDLAAALLKQRLLFSVAILILEVRLALHAAGIGTIEVSGLLASLDSMRARVFELAPNMSAA